VFNAFRRPPIGPIPVTALATWALAVACSTSTSHVDADVQQSATFASGADCLRVSLRPSALPPGDGMWMDKDAPDSTRVVAMIGPAEVRAGSTAVTRMIETIEGAGRAQAIHSRADAVVMHLELLPRYAVDRRADSHNRASADRATEPAAAYAVSTLVSVASYEACAGPIPFAVRYLRRDSHGDIAKDVMLHRASIP
jgi:hypothetical protein